MRKISNLEVHQASCKLAFIKVDLYSWLSAGCFVAFCFAGIEIRIMPNMEFV